MGMKKERRKIAKRIAEWIAIPIVSSAEDNDEDPLLHFNDVELVTMYMNDLRFDVLKALPDAIRAQAWPPVDTAPVKEEPVDFLSK